MKAVSLDSPKLPTVLLVDGNRNGSVARKQVLQEEGFAVVMAPNGEEALEVLQTNRIDLVISDYRMPRLNGTELIRRIREWKPEMPVVLLSGMVSAYGLTEESTGADLVLEKGPHEVAQMIRAVSRLLNRRTRRKPVARQGRPKRPGAKKA